MGPSCSPFPHAAHVPPSTWPSPLHPRLGLERSFPIPCCALEKSLFPRYFFHGFCWLGESVWAVQADSLQLERIAFPLLSLGELLIRDSYVHSQN